MGQQQELMTKILNLYEKRYKGKELENKFNAACEDLIDTNDIERSDYMKFCISNDLEPKLKKRNSSSYGSDPCSSGGARSSC